MDQKATFQFTQVNRQRLTNLAQWVDQNNIHINVGRVFSLDEAARALDYQKDVHPKSKVAFDLKEERRHLISSIQRTVKV